MVLSENGDRLNPMIQNIIFYSVPSSLWFFAGIPQFSNKPIRDWWCNSTWRIWKSKIGSGIIYIFAKTKNTYGDVNQDVQDTRLFSKKNASIDQKSEHGNFKLFSGPHSYVFFTWAYNNPSCEWVLDSSAACSDIISQSLGYNLYYTNFLTVTVNFLSEYPYKSITGSYPPQWSYCWLQESCISWNMP